MLRLFFAVDFEEELRAKVMHESARLKRALEPLGSRKWSWVRDQNYHLTVKFLGSVDSEQVSEIVTAARASLQGVSPFDLDVLSVGAFPRVLWLDIGDPSQLLFRIAERLDVAMSSLGFARETRPFVPHLTLARIKQGRALRPAADLAQHRSESVLGKTRVREVILYRSETLKTGAVYHALEKIPLSSETTPTST